MAVYTFRQNAPFIEQLAVYLLHHPSLSTDSLVILPSKRSCDTLTRLLMEKSIPSAPVIISLGELVDHPYARNILNAQNKRDLLRPPISSMKRQMLLATLCMKASESQQQSLYPPQALELASALASLLDEFQRHQVDINAIHTLAPEEYAEHWQRILQFMEIITTGWPQILQAEGLLDPISRRNAIYDAIRIHWQQRGMPHVIIAGSTASNKAVAELMQYVAIDPKGEVILPALPTDCAEDYWHAMTSSHPHFYTKQFLNSLSIKPREVEMLGDAPATCNAIRSSFLHQVFIPPTLAYQWLEKPACDPTVLDGIQFIEVADDLAQANYIAECCAEYCAAQKSICIVSERKHFNILLTTALTARQLTYAASESHHLKQESCGQWCMLLLQAAMEPYHPVHMLTILKHPWFNPSAEGKLLADWLDVCVLRAKLPPRGIHAIVERVQILQAAESAPVLAMLERYEQHMQPFIHLLRKPEPLAIFLERHIACMRNMADAEALEQAEANACFKYLELLAEQSTYLGPMDAEAYHTILDTMLSSEDSQNDPYADAPIRILPAEEARLETADVVMIPDLNDGIWPGEVAVNPWLSRAMQSSLGFDLDQMHASRLSHDLVMLTHARELIFVRPGTNEKGTETTPSPWWHRMYFYLKAVGMELPVKKVGNVQIAPLTFEPANQPKPIPPVSVRPSGLSLSDMELLARDPYSIYAKHILHLKPLNELTQESTQALYGQLLHKILELFCLAHPKLLPDDALAQLKSIAESQFKAFQVSQSLQLLWQPRLHAAFKRYVDMETERRPMINRVVSEQTLSHIFTIGNKTWSLYGRADRIEYYQDGTAALIDYKTGSVPLKREVTSFVACQLPAGAWLAAKDKQAPIDKVEYWQFTNKALKTSAPFESMQQQETLRQIETHVTSLLAHYDQSDTPYTATPDQSIAPAYPRYDQLSRKDEWA